MCHFHKGFSTLLLQIRDGNGDNVPIDVIKKSDGLYEYTYIPSNNTNHTVQINYGGVAVKNSPYRINVQPSSDVSKVYCFGPGIKDDVKVNNASHFTVDVRYIYVIYTYQDQILNILVLEMQGMVISQLD